MVHSMKVGSVTVDLAAATGGNIATTRADEVKNGKQNRTRNTHRHVHTRSTIVVLLLCVVQPYLKLLSRFVS